MTHCESQAIQQDLNLQSLQQCAKALPWGLLEVISQILGTHPSLRHLLRQRNLPKSLSSPFQCVQLAQLKTRPIE